MCKLSDLCNLSAIYLTDKPTIRNQMSIKFSKSNYKTQTGIIIIKWSYFKCNDFIKKLNHIILYTDNYINLLHNYYQKKPPFTQEMAAITIALKEIHKRKDRWVIYTESQSFIEHDKENHPIRN